MQVRDGCLEPKGYEQIVSAGAAFGLVTTGTAEGAKYALLKAITKAFRWRDDGTDPTGTTGMLIDIGDEFMYTGKLAKLRLIEDGATSTATLQVAKYA